ncbi:Uncharacterised protein [Brevundimonas diminuta]|uniref:hypothetical protein n=1 Tax=Brevundimonas diminuta TaxID=293 RepID=UPI000D91903C|nr:hypothetical protein [Brevundimonas diminuta]SPU43207.1 Uncharacterised protein [Brevundimonas diminuta]
MKLPITVSHSSPATNAVVLIAVVAAGAALYWLRDILTPLAMAVFLMIMIDGVKRAIERRTPIPPRFAGAAALIVVVLGFLASIWIIVDGAAGFFTDASGVAGSSARASTRSARRLALVGSAAAHAMPDRHGGG